MPAFKLFMFFLFLSFLSNFMGFTTAADPTYLTDFCLNTTTFTRNSTFQSNLNLFLSSLPTNASRSNGFSGCFYNATAGQPSYSDRVYGLFRCRGDLGSTACQDCVTFAARNIKPDKFNKFLGNLMNQVDTQAVNDPKRFGIRKANYTAFQTVYSLVQCTPDLSSRDCEHINMLWHILNGSHLANVGNLERYEFYPFYNESVIVVLPSPPPAASVTRPQADNDITTLESLQFDFETIEDATNKFSTDNKLGEGGFGVLPNEHEIAVKRLSRSSSQGAQEINNEVVVVAKLQHINLVRLLGFCLEREEKILVYEYVPNKRLDNFLYG
ncbi:cysteine-rich receptor-like protein kinase 25 [Citrus sinensis]|uniref:Cysteine-rich receptor-like protein kinase 25 n=1 Tax=Citrus sinensis TaxID=2711 RepID=A0ACB8M0X7_CITSI|nr:cysteine-rich receptor-like protein kinase 25 [Citrus sinensis]